MLRGDYSLSTRSMPFLGHPLPSTHGVTVCVSTNQPLWVNLSYIPLCPLSSHLAIRCGAEDEHGFQMKFVNFAESIFELANTRCKVIYLSLSSKWGLYPCCVLLSVYVPPI